MIDSYCNKVINASFSSAAPNEEEIRFIKNGYNHSTRDNLYKIAHLKKILPFVGRLMSNLGIEYDFWNDIVKSYRQRNTYLLQILGVVFSAFRNHEVRRVFVYENFGALLSSGNDIALFASGDIDLYADPSERAKIERALEECGFFIKWSDSSRELVASGYYRKDLEEQFYISIMWQPLSRKKLPFFNDIDYFINWEHSLFYKNTEIVLPSIETLAYLCILHVSVHGYSRPPDVRLYADLNNVAILHPDWRKVLDFAEHDGYVVRVKTVCTIARELFALEVPAFLTDASSAERKWIRRLLPVVYDRGNSTLKYKLTPIDILKIESYSDSRSLVEGGFRILFPDRKWIRFYYQLGERTMIWGYIKHLLQLLGK